MGLIERIKTLWKPETKEVIGQRIKSFGWNEFFGSGAGSDAWRKQQTPTRANLINEYKNTVYACITENTTLVMSANLRAYRKQRQGQRMKSLWPIKTCDYHTTDRVTKAANLRLADGEQLAEITDHPLLALLDRPNPYMSGRGLIEITQMFQELCGVAYWYVDKNAIGTPGQIFVLYPQYVHTIRDQATGFPLFYEYGIGGGKERYELDEVIPFVLPSPYDPLRTKVEGYSPLLSVFEQTEIYDFFNATQLALLQNEGRPNGILSFRDGIGSDERKRVKHEFNQNNRRAGAGNVIVLDEEGSFTPISWAPSDLGRLKVGDTVSEAICNAYDVPPALFQKELGTYQSYATACESHVARAIKPRLDRNQSILQMYLVPMFDHADLILAYDDPSPKNREQKLAEDQTLVTIGAKTPNEVRKERGLPPVAWGDLPAGMYTQQQQEASKPDATPEPKPEADAGANGSAEPVVESDGGTASEPAPQTGKEEQAQSALMGMVGGVQAALQILDSLATGEIGRDTAIAALHYVLSPIPSRGRGHRRPGTAPEPPQPTPGSEPGNEAAEPAVAPSESQSDTASESKAHTKAHSQPKGLPEGKELAAVVRSFFDRQAKAVLKHLNQSKGIKADLPRSFVDLDDWTDDLYRDSLPVIEVYAKESYNESRKDLIRVGASPDAFNVTNPKLKEGIQKATYQFCEATNATTSLKINEALKQLREQINEGLVDEGDSVVQLRKRVL